MKHFSFKKHFLHTHVHKNPLVTHACKISYRYSTYKCIHSIFSVLWTIDIVNVLHGGWFVPCVCLICKFLRGKKGNPGLGKSLQCVFSLSLLQHNYL